MTIQNPMLFWEEETKIRLRDWGYTELLTYSMISEEQMDTFVLDKSKAYKISNPLSNEWLYMRPSLLPSVLSAVKQNLNIREDLKLFELSFVYELRQNDLPLEKPMLIVVWTGKKYPEAKGLAEALFDVFGIPFPEAIKEYGSIEILAGEITVLYLDFSRLVANAKPIKTYKPIPKYPPIVEDLAFVVPEQFEVGPLIALLKKAHPLVFHVSLLDVHGSMRTFHIEYQNSKKNLTNEYVTPIREKLIRLAEEKFGVTIKNP